MKYVERIRNIVLDQLKNETVCIYLFVFITVGLI